LISDSNARLGAARGLTSRRGRRETGRFLAEGPQAVREALRHRIKAVIEIFATAPALERHADLVALALAAGVTVDEISPKAAGGLSETVNPQGIIAVCAQQLRPIADVLAGRPRLVAVLVDANDPGNAGTILRTADAAGADALVFAGESVDPYNGKCVRATAGSLFHLDVSVVGDPLELFAAETGLLSLATTGVGALRLDELDLSVPTLWLFGNEAHGLPAAVLEAADARVRVPIYGHAESLNLASAAAVCLYASASAQRSSTPVITGPA
jgi:TrmH family RNA methyltransferase